MGDTQEVVERKVSFATAIVTGSLLVAALTNGDAETH